MSDWIPVMVAQLLLTWVLIVLHAVTEHSSTLALGR